MTFLRYPHLCKYGNIEVQDIEYGVAHIFPKLDGTNSSVWYSHTHDGQCDSTIVLGTGSRNRTLHMPVTGGSAPKDNAGFNAWAQGQCSYGGENNGPLGDFFSELSNRKYRLYGEWLVPHTVQHYHDSAWRKFYIFDVLDEETGKFLEYEVYQPLLEQFKLDYVPCIQKIKNGSWENFLHVAKTCRYLLKDENDSPGEGIVIKNYGWSNKQNTQVWAKVVTAEFKDDFHKAMGPNVLEGKSPAQAICDKACTSALVEKEYAKIVVAEGEWSNKFIPRLFHTVYYSVVTEELWDCLKDLKFNALVNFKELQQLCIQKVKQTKPELFSA